MNPLELNGFGGEVVVQKEAYLVREGALNEAKDIVEVSDAFTKEIAVDVLKQIKGITSDVEKARKELKAPVLELGKKIDTCAASYVENLQKEYNRINRLLSLYAAEELKRQQEEQRRIEAEQRRLEAEKEAQRKQLEEAKSIEEKAEISEKIETTVKLVADTKAVAKQATPKVEGVTVKQSMDFEILDIEAVAIARPDLVIIKPNRRAILEAIKTETKINGLRIFPKVSTSVRR